MVGALQLLVGACYMRSEDTTLTPQQHTHKCTRQLAASAAAQAECERQLSLARADAARAAAERDDLQKKLVWWQQELESAQAEADLYAKSAKAARLEASRAASALKEGFSAAAAAFARGLERSGSLAASENAPGSGSKRSARRWCVALAWLCLGLLFPAPECLPGNAVLCAASLTVSCIFAYGRRFLSPTHTQLQSYPQADRRARRRLPQQPPL